MRITQNLYSKVLITAGLWFGFCGALMAQGSQSSQSGQGGQSQPPAQSTDKSKTPDVTPLTLDSAPPPVNAEEDAAFKTFQAVPQSDVKQKIQAGEAFLQKYPETRYKAAVYAPLAFACLQDGQVQKMQEYGEKEVALVPNDVTTLALLGQTLPRNIHSNTPQTEAAQLLEKAEKYSKQAIEITPTIPKPANLTDEAFAAAKNQNLAMAHSGLGLVYIRRGKNAEAITELDEAVKVDPNPDPVNYYLLGMANKSTSHFDDAITAFNKCAAMPGQMQAQCKAQADETKKKSSTELSAPK
ncbi:MAG TPA: tetratricopeptide repeat protein [Candidatus Acidoferrum sp.]|nr:tetratricopeptide repeat protein [Candidatus Acidoferrum sp.]